MNKILKIVIFGFLTWIIPFVVSFFFYTPQGQLLMDVSLFKSLMIVVGSLTGALFLVLYFRKVEKNYLQEGITVGMLWFVLNILLDLIVLVPMTKISVETYFAQIGLRYLLIPIMSISIGYVAQSTASKIK